MFAHYRGAQIYPHYAELYVGLVYWGVGWEDIFCLEVNHEVNVSHSGNEPGVHEGVTGILDDAMVP